MMYERFAKLFSKKHEDENKDETQIGSPTDVRKGNGNATIQHDALPKFKPEGLISREAAQSKLSKEDQTKVLEPWQRRPVAPARDIRFDSSAPISLQDAKAEFATVAEAQAILKDATQHRDQNAPVRADKVQPTVTQPAAIKPGNDVKQTWVRPVKPAPQWTPAKPNVQSTRDEILEQNKRESTPRLDTKTDPELGRTHSSKQL